MTLHEFDQPFDRLLKHFRLPPGVDKADVMSEWFDAFKHLHVDAFDAGVTLLIRRATETWWPAMGAAREVIQSRLDRYDRTGHCPTCHGGTWVQGWPVWSSGRVYATMTRCADCGVPAPSVPESKHTRPLTRAEEARWRAGQLPAPELPPWALAKQESPGGDPAIAALAAALRAKLFGPTSEVA
jgi:transcription elongation factor Elf1